MAVRNLTTKKVLTKKAKLCKSHFSKTIGLMFSKKIRDKSLVFMFNKESFVSLHMFFVFFSIDIIFLDKNKTVVDLKHNVKPFTPLILPKKPAKFVIECPSSTIKKSKTKIGHRLDFNKKDI